MIVVGVDVSKLTLDIYCKPLEQALRIENQAKGFKQWYKGLCKSNPQNLPVLVVMEHTGRYSHRFEAFLHAQQIAFCKIPALQIKRSLGMIRGKTDKIDAARICSYAWLRRELLVADEPIAAEINQLRDVLSLRDKLVKDRSGYMSRLKEMKASGSSSRELEKIQRELIELLSKKIKELETKVRSLINQCPVMQKTYALLKSIKGVGMIVAAYMIACTGNFKRFANARKFNCYAGLAPFQNESGTSFRGRAKVSHLANKVAKTLLNLAACAARRYDAELKNYYERKLAEGKSKMGCLNIIRSKLVSRMFAVVKRQTPYVEIGAAA